MAQISFDFLREEEREGRWREETERFGDKKEND